MANFPSKLHIDNDYDDDESRSLRVFYWEEQVKSTEFPRHIVPIKRVIMMLNIPVINFSPYIDNGSPSADALEEMVKLYNQKYYGEK